MTVEAQGQTWILAPREVSTGWGDEIGQHIPFLHLRAIVTFLLLLVASFGIFPSRSDEWYGGG